MGKESSMSGQLVTVDSIMTPVQQTDFPQASTPFPSDQLMSTEDRQTLMSHVHPRWLSHTLTIPIHILHPVIRGQPTDKWYVGFS